MNNVDITIKKIQDYVTENWTKQEIEDTAETLQIDEFNYSRRAFAKWADRAITTSELITINKHLENIETADFSVKAALFIIMNKKDKKR